MYHRSSGAVDAIDAGMCVHGDVLGLTGFNAHLRHRQDEGSIPSVSTTNREYQFI